MTENSSAKTSHERGVALIVVIWVMGFLLSIGLVLLTVTGTGPKVAGNVRTQQQAFNSAEAGFDVAWDQIEEFFETSVWSTFDNHYLTAPSGVDIPTDDVYFRKLTNLEILNYIDPNEDGTPDVDNVLFCRQPYVQKQDGSWDLRYTFTAFLIDDEAGGGTAAPNDAILVCIGCAGIGNNLTTVRLEIELAVELTE
ncbi:MAG: hypothetical protein JSV96_19130 [Candidatus Aminicenantes bacterium]|nr:MAG: hypothetical protein JSV96_19130 [Candidatus Aminicenantes bacterium]